MPKVGYTSLVARTQISVYSAHYMNIVIRILCIYYTCTSRLLYPRLICRKIEYMLDKVFSAHVLTTWVCAHYQMEYSLKGYAV